MTWLGCAGLVAAAAGALWAMWPGQDVDTRFRPPVARPAYTGQPWPRVVIDEGHYNIHTAGGSYRPFAQLLVRDGFRVLAGEGRVSGELLRNADVFVTANALGFAGVLQHAANLARLERVVRLDPDAFSQEEVQVLQTWVEQGGRALIVADHAPAGDAARRLAAAFGVEMLAGWAEDAAHLDPESQNPGVIRFTRDSGRLRDHPITAGRDRSERLDVVMTFTGQALRAPVGADVILQLPGTARIYPFRVSREREGQSAAGLAQAIALRHGRGRVVILGEAGALTAQVVESVGAPPLAMGMNRAGTDNVQFALNIMHWLMGLLP
jgi:hypothetical protein